MKYFIIFLLLVLAISSSLAQDTIGNRDFPSVLNAAVYLFATSGLNLQLYQATLTPSDGDGSGVPVDELTNVIFYGQNSAGAVYALQANATSGFGTVYQYLGTAPPYYKSTPLDVSTVNTTIEDAVNFLMSPPLLGADMTRILRATLQMTRYLNGGSSSPGLSPQWGFFLPDNIMCSVSMDRYAGCAQSG